MFNPKKAKFYIGQKFPEIKETTKVPGAGSYDPSPEKTRKTLPSFSMGKKLESSLVTKNIAPGPGNY